MRSFSKWVIALCASPLGVIVLAALDSTLFFSLPFGIDAAVVLLSARLHGLAWLVPLLATGGSIAGAWLTFWMGEKIGEKGLDRFVDEGRLEKIHRKVKESGAIALAVLDFIPPPFPFTAFVLAAGALEVDRLTFFLTLAIVRIVRFGIEAALAVVYGNRIIGWMDSDIFHDVVAFFMFAAFALTAWSIVKLIRSSRTSGRRSAPRVPA
ncbi:MAG TPA: VTT domain-containing protein [Vicinamibacterales bacterium]|nr:VTT domain-containing protein [Vicinamibacterales bacterium]